MAKLPGWIKTIETETKGGQVVLRCKVRWWHPALWGVIAMELAARLWKRIR